MLRDVLRAEPATPRYDRQVSGELGPSKGDFFGESCDRCPLLGVGMIFGTDYAKPKPEATRVTLGGRFVGGCLAYVVLYAANLSFYFGFCFLVVRSAARG
jgi:hypothetical protein